MHYSKKELNKNLLSFPRLNLTLRQTFDLEMLANGSFFPLKGFMDEQNYLAVVEKMRLSNTKLWPIPIVLDVENKNEFAIGSEIFLCDIYGTPLAIMKISSIFKPNKTKEANLVYGTTNQEHFGVHYLFHRTKPYYMSGEIISLRKNKIIAYQKYYHTPKQLKSWFIRNNWSQIIGFQTRNPIHKAHFEIMKRASDAVGGNILIQPVVGTTKEGDIDVETRIRCYIHAYNKYLKSIGKLSFLPLAMRMAGPREAVWHTIIRKNYGCTHFIVGRDHAGPGKDKKGASFYGPYDAQKFVKKYENELGISIIALEEMVYFKKRNAYVFKSEVSSDKEILSISGTRLREMLLNNEPIPEWFSFPEVIEELRQSITKGFAIFFTGLPSSGKSTIANHLYHKLLQIQKRRITLLDGDMIRTHLSKGLGFSKHDRNENIKRIGFVAREVVKHGGIAICAAIAPYQETRRWNRENINEYGFYIEVYISTPLAVCRKRDIKGLYQKARKGLIKNFTGFNDPYEVPEKPELTIDASKKAPHQAVTEILRYLKFKKLI